jgi:hypothetical protein
VVQTGEHPFGTQTLFAHISLAAQTVFPQVATQNPEPVSQVPVAQSVFVEHLPGAVPQAARPARRREERAVNWRRVIEISIAARSRRERFFMA